MGEGERVLQIGGVAGLLAGVIALVSIILGVALLPPGDVTTDDFLGSVFPENRAIFTLTGVLNLIAILIAVPLVLALYRGLKETSPEYAVGGLLLYFVFVGLFAVRSMAGDLSLGPLLADQYATGNDTDRRTIVLIFEATAQLINTVLIVGFIFFVLAALALGVVMLGNPDYGRTFGGVSLLLGLIGIPFIVLSLGLIVYVLVIIFWLVFGWKVYSLSRSASRN